jgi:hypothetical protein
LLTLEATDGREQQVAVKARTIFQVYLKEVKMAGKSKRVKKLEDHHDYLKRKVDELTKDRLKDRSAESKTLLMRLKKTKLALKDAIAKAKATLTK